MNISQEIIQLINSEYNEYYNKLKFLKEIELGDKLYSDGENVLIDKPSYYQGLMRYIYGESRQTGLNYIKKILDSYLLFLKNTLDSCVKHNLTYSAEELIFGILELNKDISEGLKVLDLTYENFDELKKYIEYLNNQFLLFSFNIYKNKNN
jgi:hypothetical protein